MEPFALWMLTFQKETVESKAKAVVRKLGLKEEKTAIDGAMEILAENFGENPQTRQMVRDLADNRGKIVAARKKNAEDAQEVYKNYYEFEALAKNSRHIKCWRLIAEKSRAFCGSGSNLTMSES